MKRGEVVAKSKYHTHVEPRLIEVEGWARDGLTDEQIAHNLGVAYSTFRDYVNKFSALSAPLKRGKEVVDREVENALLKNALGYEAEEVTEEYDADGKLVSSKRVKKRVAPNTTAQIFWLKNRKPADWRDKKDVDVVGEIKTQNSFENLTKEQLLDIAKLGNKDG